MMAAGVGLLSSTSGIFAPFWAPVLFLSYDADEITRALVLATVGVGVIFGVFGMLFPAPASAVLGSALVSISLMGQARKGRNRPALYRNPDSTEPLSGPSASAVAIPMEPVAVQIPEQPVKTGWL